MANIEQTERVAILLVGLFSTLKIAVAVEIREFLSCDKFIFIFSDFHFLCIFKKKMMKAINMKNASALQLNIAIVQEYMMIFGHTTRTAASNIPIIIDRADSSLIFALAPILISTLPSPADLKSKISTAVELRDITLVRIDP